MPNFNQKFSCKLTDFANAQLTDRGHMDFTGHIDAQGNVRGAAHQYHEGSTVIDYTVDGSIKLIGGLWVIDLTRNDNRVVYKGFLVEDDAGKDEMTFVVLKHVAQPLVPLAADERTKAALRPTLLDQVEEPWVITKP